MAFGIDRASIKYILVTLRSLIRAEVAYQAPNKFLFIVGCGRSGNTLLRKILMSRFDIFIPPESYVLPSICDFKRTNRNVSWKDLVLFCLAKLEQDSDINKLPNFRVSELRAHLLTFDREKQSLGHLIYGVYAYLDDSDRQENTLIGDKTPFNTFYLNNLDKLFKHPYYIFIVRHPLDVVNSYMKSGLIHDPIAAATRWVNSHKSWQRFCNYNHPENKLILKYEDLVADHLSATSLMQTFLKVSARSDNIEKTYLGDVETMAHHQNVLNPINVNSVGRGRNELPQKTVDKVYDIVQPYLSIYGYEWIQHDQFL